MIRQRWKRSSYSGRVGEEQQAIYLPVTCTPTCRVLLTALAKNVQLPNSFVVPSASQGSPAPDTSFGGMSNVRGDHSPSFRSSVPPPNRGYVRKQFACPNPELRSKTECVSEAVWHVRNFCRRRKLQSAAASFCWRRIVCATLWSCRLWNILPNFGNQGLQRSEIWHAWDCMRGFHVYWDRWSRGVRDFGPFCAFPFTANHNFSTWLKKKARPPLNLPDRDPQITRHFDRRKRPPEAQFLSDWGVEEEI
jgi:hypothetical protein